MRAACNAALAPLVPAPAITHIVGIADGIERGVQRSGVFLGADDGIVDLLPGADGGEIFGRSPTGSTPPWLREARWKNPAKAAKVVAVRPTARKGAHH